MKHDTALTATSLLAVLLLSLHLASDVVLGKDEFDRSMMIGVLLLAVWLYGALALRGRMAGYVVQLLFSALATGIPWLHMPAAGLSPEFVRRPGCSSSCGRSWRSARRGWWCSRSRCRGSGGCGGGVGRVRRRWAKARDRACGAAREDHVLAGAAGRMGYGDAGGLARESARMRTIQ